MGKNKRKKKSGTQWLIILGYALLGAACGLLMMLHISHLREMSASKTERLIHLFALFLGMYVVIMVQIIVHEAGHLIFGLLSGYRFSSFRIFSLMLLNENGRFRIRKLRLAGTGGQCLMAPPDLKDGKIPVMFYNFGGAIMNFVTGGIALGTAFLCPAYSFGQMILLLFGIAGIVLGLMNGLPLKTGAVNNDGRNAIDISRDPEAMRAFWVQLTVNEQISKGVRLKDMPAEWFTASPGADMKNSIIATVALMAANRLMDQQKFEEADRAMARLSSGGGLVGMHEALLVCDRMYVELITKNRAEVLNRMRSKVQQKYMKALRNFPSVLRTEYSWALLHDKDQAKADTVLQQFEKHAKSYPYPNEITGERELLEIANRKREDDSVQRVVTGGVAERRTV